MRIRVDPTNGSFELTLEVTRNFANCTRQRQYFTRRQTWIGRNRDGEAYSLKFKDENKIKKNQDR